MKYIHTLLWLLCLACLMGCTKANEAKPDESRFFVKLFGGAKNDRAREILSLPNGGYAGIGYTESYATKGVSDAFFFLLDNNGNVTTQIGVGGSNGNSIKITPDGGFIVVGDSIEANASTSAYIVKTNKDGLVQWRKGYRPSEVSVDAVIKGISIQNNIGGGYWLLGSSEHNNTSSIFITQISETGTVLRERLYGFASTTNAIATITQNAIGDIAVAGTVNTNNIANPKDMRVLLTNRFANLKWDYAFNKNPDDVGVDLQLLSNGFVLLGTTTLNDNSDIVVTRLNEVGEVTLSVSIGGEGNQVAKSVAPTEDGGFIVVGNTPGTGVLPQTDIYIAKLNYNGEVEWSKTFGSSENDSASVVRQDKDGNYVILANIGFVTTEMCGVIRLNAKGSFLK